MPVLSNAPERCWTIQRGGPTVKSMAYKGLRSTTRSWLAILSAIAGATFSASCRGDLVTSPGQAPTNEPALSAPPGTIFGQPVGSFQSVTIYSNSDVGKPVPAPTWTYGEKWQCVEFARRYTSLRYGTMLPTVYSAYDFWYKTLPSLRRVLNNAVELPQTGDLLIMSGGNGGHIAVVASVSGTSTTVAQQNTVSPIQQLSISMKTLGGTPRYSISPLTNHTTAGWFTRKAAPILFPSITSHAPLSLRVSSQAQSVALVTSGVSDASILFLYDPYGYKVVFKMANVSLTPSGMVFRPNLYQAGKWSVQLQTGGLTSARYYFTVTN